MLPCSQKCINQHLGVHAIIPYLIRCIYAQYDFFPFKKTGEKGKESLHSQSRTSLNLALKILRYYINKHMVLRVFSMLNFK